MSVRRGATWLAVGLAVSVTVACSGPGAQSSSSASVPSASTSLSAAPTDPTEAVQAAADRTFLQGSYHVVSGFDVTGGGQSISFASESDVDVDSNASSASATFDGFPGMPDGTAFEMVMIGQQMWMRSPMLGQGDAWVTFDMAQLARTNPQLAGLGTGMNDPRMASNFMAGAKDMRDQGPVERSGEQMVRYAGTVDFKEAAAAAPPEQREGMEATLQRFIQLGATEADATVWIDGDGYVREIEYVLTPKMIGGPDTKLTMHSVISDIGEPLTIAKPSGTVIQAPGL